MDKELIDAFKRKREELGLTQRKISTQCGWKRNCYGLFERGKRSMNVEELSKVANVLGLELVRHENIEDEQ